MLIQQTQPVALREPQTNVVPDESLAADILPIVLGVSMLLAIGVCGVLLIWDTSARIGIYSIPLVLVLGTIVSGRRYGAGHARQAGLIIAYTYGLVPLLSLPLFGVQSNPVMYMAPIGVSLAALLVSADAASVLARLYGMLLIGTVLLFVSPLLNAVLPILAVLLLLTITTVLSWMGAYSIQGTIEWALETGYKSERREQLLRATQGDLESALHERDRLNDQLQQSNHDLERARAAAEAAYRSKASFMATMSHELRTPLNLVIGFSTAMIEHPEMYADEALPALYRADIAEIQQSGRHLLQIINDILDLAKVEAGRLELQSTALDVVPLLHRYTQSVGSTAQERSLNLIQEFPAELPLVLADEIRVRQILLNLMSNACKFTYTGEVALGARIRENMVEIWVRDTGIGIEKDHQERIFGEFEQVESHDAKQQNGTGLGLSICRWLVELHGGQLRLTSDLGRGSTFFFTLPRFDLQAQRPLMDVAHEPVSE